MLQEVSDDARNALLFGFKGDGQDGRLVVRPRGLLADATYDVRSLDAGALGASRGDALMVDGIELIHCGGSRAHLLVLTAVESSRSKTESPATTPGRDRTRPALVHFSTARFQF